MPLLDPMLLETLFVALEPLLDLDFEPPWYTVDLDWDARSDSVDGSRFLLFDFRAGDCVTLSKLSSESKLARSSLELPSESGSLYDMRFRVERPGRIETVTVRLEWRAGGIAVSSVEFL